VATGSSLTAFAQQPTVDASIKPASDPATPPAPYPFVVRSADGRSFIRIGGLLQFDLHAFPGNSGQTGNSGFEMRRARAILAGSFDSLVDFRLVPEFGEGKSGIQEAWIDLHLRPNVELRSGKIEERYSLERFEPTPAIRFVERSIATNLFPFLDVGMVLMGQPGKSGVEWDLGVVNGVQDGVNADTNPDNNEELLARLFYHPFARHPKTTIQDFGFGVAAMTGQANEPLSTVAFKTAGRSTFFQYENGGVSDGNRTHLAPQMYFYSRSLGILTEQFTSRQRLHKGSFTEAGTLQGMNIQAVYSLSGEKESYGNIIPNHPFDPATGHGGAYEVAFRYANFRASDNIFSHGFADPTLAARKADAYTIGVNWYLNKQLRAQLNYERTQFGAPIQFPVNTTNHEDTLLTELQVQF
jgi:phosphate-selective porin OprO/OprP